MIHFLLDTSPVRFFLLSYPSPLRDVVHLKRPTPIPGALSHHAAHYPGRRGTLQHAAESAQGICPGKLALPSPNRPFIHRPAPTALTPPQTANCPIPGDPNIRNPSARRLPVIEQPFLPLHGFLLFGASRLIAWPAGRTRYNPRADIWPDCRYTVAAALAPKPGFSAPLWPTITTAAVAAIVATVFSCCCSAGSLAAGASTNCNRRCLLGT